MTGDFDVVTGAFSYSGAVIPGELQAAGRRVRTLTGHPGRSQVVRVPGSLIQPTARLLGLALRDTLLTAEEFEAMADGLADTDGRRLARPR